jgi:ABC-type amino acid transport substrate-binding protein
LTKTIAIFLLFFIPTCFFSQSPDTLFINYYSDAPFATSKDGNVTGIEIDIIKDYLDWLKNTKKMEQPVKYVSFSNFDELYNTTKKAGKNTIGLGGIVITPERLKEVDMMTPYLKNVAFCITNGNAPDIKTKAPAEIVKSLGSMTALTVTNTNLSSYVNELKKLYVHDLKIKEMSDQVKILDEIAKNVLYFGYVEAIEFWFYLKSNPQKFLKMQKPLNQAKEELAFITPKGGPHKALFNEFFGAATGFKTTRNYRAILEKYVGSYMTQNMAIN